MKTTSINLFIFIILYNVTHITFALELEVGPAIPDGNGGVQVTLYIKGDDAGELQAACIGINKTTLISTNIQWNNDYNNIDWSDENNDPLITDVKETHETTLWEQTSYLPENISSFCSYMGIYEGFIVVYENNDNQSNVVRMASLVQWREESTNANFDGMLTLHFPAGSKVLGGHTFKLSAEELDRNIKFRGFMVRSDNRKSVESKMNSGTGELAGIDNTAIVPASWLYPGIEYLPAVYSVYNETINNKVTTRVACLAENNNGQYTCLNAEYIDEENTFPTSIKKTDENINNLKMLECGNSEDFTAREGYVSLAVQTGDTGYSENNNTWCDKLNNLTRHWVNVTSELGEALYVSNNPYTGALECLSNNNGVCLNEKNASDAIDIQFDFENNINKAITSSAAINESSLCRYATGDINICPNKLQVIFN
ncbi:hypothetical protein [Shewanella surugensis]|uniref:Uncharacterized protein n=1 Tax=Shewanella surugensis TaxID=212020 RepID=A0ABT0LKD1_9GAMM|nr:hypothetical protein [Shewanella surugensis]MCL1127611.1 hypothetical protein [Shewanella surugensis]